jgi:hypothetical protein
MLIINGVIQGGGAGGGTGAFTDGILTVGVEDTQFGMITAYGHATGSTQGGKVVLETADDYDGTINSFGICVVEDDLLIGPDTNPDLIKLTPDGYIHATEGVIYLEQSGVTGIILSGLTGNPGIEIGAHGVHEGSLNILGDGAGSTAGGRIQLHVADDHDSTIAYYGLQPVNDDFRIGRNDGLANLLYDGGDETWNIEGGPLNLGKDDTTPGILTIYGGWNAEDGGLLRIHTPADQDSTVDYYQMAVLANTDDLIIGTDADPDMIKIIGGATIDFTRGLVRMGESGVSPGFLDLQGSATGSIFGGRLRIYTADDHDAAIAYFGIWANEDDLMIGPITDADSLKYDGGADQWVFTGANGVKMDHDPNDADSLKFEIEENISYTATGYRVHEHFMSDFDSTADQDGNDIDYYGYNSYVTIAAGADHGATSLLESFVSIFNISGGVDVASISGDDHTFQINNSGGTIDDLWSHLTTFVQQDGTTTNFYGNLVEIIASGGTLTNSYILRGTVSGSPTNNWGIHITGETKSHLSGNLNIGAGSGYLNFGGTDGTGGYGVRDNSGQMEYKDTGGAWTDFSVGMGAHDHDGDTLQFDGVSSNGGAFSFSTSGAITFSNTVALTTVVNASTDTDKFLVLDGSNNVDFRTGAEVVSDIGALTSLSGAVLIDGTVALSANWDAGSFKITAEQFESDIVTGTAPFIVASTTMVSSLNADLLDGQHASAFLTALTGAVLVDGTAALTANWDAGAFKITAETLESDVTTGTSPLVIASTTVVTNLNADLLDGQHASAFLTSLPAHDHDGDTLQLDGVNSDGGAFSFTTSAAVNFAFGNISVGVADTTKGRLFLYGDAAGSGGGIVQLDAGDAHNGTIDSYTVQVFEDDLYLGPNTDVDLVKIAGGATPQFQITANGLAVTGTTTLNTVINAGVDTDKFLVLDGSGNVDFRTGAELASDVGALTSLPAHDHDGDTLQADGINSNGGAFSFTTSGAVTFSNDVKANKTITFNAEYDEGAESGAFTVDWNNGQKQKVTITGTTLAVTLTAPPGPGNFLLKVVQGDGADTVTWPGTVLWPGGAAPTLSTGSGEVDIISFYYDGTNYYGVSSLDFS